MTFRFSYSNFKGGVTTTLPLVVVGHWSNGYNLCLIYVCLSALFSELYGEAERDVENGSLPCLDTIEITGHVKKWLEAP